MGEIKKYTDKSGSVYYKNRITIHDELGNVKKIRLAPRFKNETEALKLEEEYKKKFDFSGAAPKKYSTFDFLLYWLEKYKNALKISTYESYKLNILRIKPHIGNIELSKLKPAQILELYAMLGKTLAPKTIRNIHMMLRLAFKYAVYWDILNSNITDRVFAPKVFKKEMAFITDSDLNKIFKELRNHESYIVFYTLAVTGARVGEICALKRKNIDLNNRMFYIETTLNQFDFGTKTKNSCRAVAMLKGTEEIYKKYFTAFKKSSEENAFTWPDERIFTVDFLSKKFKKAVRKLNLNERYTLHSLRHTHASQLLKAGVNPKIVQERLGHSSIKITMDTYSHITPTIQMEALNNAAITIPD
jgi:integrase